MSEIVQIDSGSGCAWAVLVVFGRGGALRLGEWSDHGEAMRQAETWAAALHREGEGGCVVLSR